METLRAGYGPPEACRGERRGNPLQFQTLPRGPVCRAHPLKKLPANSRAAQRPQVNQLERQQQRAARAVEIFRAKSKLFSPCLANVTKSLAKPPAPHREHMRAMGAQGGLSKSPVKSEAARENLKVANTARRFLHPSPRTSAERQRAYRERKKKDHGNL